jgi:hypothetical protein
MDSFPIRDVTDGRYQSDSDLGGLTYWAGSVFFILLSAVIFLVNTRYGIGILVDSIRYMGISEVPYDAPLYPWLLQLVSLSGASLEFGAKALGLIFVCMNTALIWHLLVRATRKYHYAAFGTALIVLSPQFVTQHANAMSEPPFLLFLLLTLLALLHYFQSERRTWLVASAVALGLATLTRFTAPPLGAAVALCLLLNPRHGVARRFSDAAIFAAVSAFIFLLWLIISQMMVGHSIGRELRFHGNMGIPEWLSSIGVLTAWLLPDKIPFVVRVVASVGFFVAGAWLTFVHSRQALQRARDAKAVDALLPTILGLFFIFYMAFMVLSTSIEANLSLTGRYAFPAYVTTILMMTVVLAHFGGSSGLTKWLHHGLVLLFILVLGSHVLRTTSRSQEAYRSGTGFVSLTWLNSPTLQFLRELPAGTPIYSNGQDVIAFALKRKSHSIPLRIQLRTGLEDPNNTFEMQFQNLRNALANEGAYIAIFDNIDWRFYLATEAELKQHLPLDQIATESDGRIYVMSKTPKKE